MLEWFSNLRFNDALILVCVCTLVLVTVWTAFATWHRSRRLARTDPPTEMELEEVRALRLAGAFHLPGRSSAPARHFERSLRDIGDTSRDGASGCYEPKFVDSWRDRRSASDDG